ncbi:MAG: GntR family transcriptional regulator [Rhodospirillaceae bacterium]|nr:GntR family transcriptional regulator [Rhodospirillaceae bacterium]
MSHTLSRADEITRALRDDILRGQYRAGERVPSERDLAARFATSRGTVREALKKLEQLGIASIQPGGARVVPVQECTLDVLGPLLELNEFPDAELMGQVLDIGTLLIGYAAESAVARGDPAALARVEAVIDEILAAEPEDLAQIRVPRRLGRAFAHASGNLVLLLIVNGLRTQLPDPRRVLGGPPRIDPKALKRVVADLKAAVAQRDGSSAGSSMRELMALMRAAARETLRSHRANANETPLSHRSNAKETNS